MNNITFMNKGIDLLERKWAVFVGVILAAFIGLTISLVVVPSAIVSAQSDVQGQQYANTTKTTNNSIACGANVGSDAENCETAGSVDKVKKLLKNHH